VKGNPVKGNPVKGNPVKGNPVKGNPVKGNLVKGNLVRRSQLMIPRKRLAATISRKLAEPWNGPSRN
jgi:hypothetical protein